MKNLARGLIYVFAIIGFVLVAVYISVQLGWTKSSGIVDTQHDYFKNKLTDPRTTTEIWAQGEEWNVLKQAIIKDRESINQAAERTGTKPRLIVATLIVEQLRLFHSNREVFKSVFAPLKILGNQSQFSWGVMGIKQDTARQIEDNLKNPQSPWYLGESYSRLLDYATLTGDLSPTKTVDENDAERFTRLTNEEDRYFSYLYAAILLKELESQWNNAGFPIANRPEVLATLFNIGFINSHPNAEPKVGGAEIEIDSTIYSFGGLAGSFYYSNELLQEFPR